MTRVDPMGGLKGFSALPWGFYPEGAFRLKGGNYKGPRELWLPGPFLPRLRLIRFLDVEADTPGRHVLRISGSLVHRFVVADPVRYRTGELPPVMVELVVGG